MAAAAPANPVVGVISTPTTTRHATAEELEQKPISNWMKMASIDRYTTKKSLFRVSITKKS